MWNYLQGARQQQKIIPQTYLPFFPASFSFRQHSLAEELPILHIGEQNSLPKMIEETQRSCSAETSRNKKAQLWLANQRTASASIMRGLYLRTVNRER